MPFLLLLLFTFLLNGSLQAHPGVSDQRGCHVNSDNGHKHCHEIKKIKTSKKKESAKKTKLAKKKTKSSTSVQ